MSEVTLFARQFVETEHRALEATLEEEDDADAFAAIARAQKMLASDVSLHFGRPLGLPPELRADLRATASDYVPRTLFAIRRFVHARYGDVAQAIVSWNQAYGDRRYYDSFFIARIDGNLRVIARYGLEDSQTAVIWKHITGAEIGSLGTPIETARFEAPDDPVHRRDWERDQ